MAFVNKLVSKYLEEGRDGEGRGGTGKGGEGVKIFL